MKILFVHPNFPGQWRGIAPALARLGHEVSGLGKGGHRPTLCLPGVTIHTYKDSPFSFHSGYFQPGQSLAASVRQGRAAADLCRKLKREGYAPDVIVGHPGWGDMMFLKEVWPEARIIAYLEYYYRSANEDLNFDPEFALETADREYIRLRNLNQLMAYEIADVNVTATHWQKSLFPPSIRDRIEVIHEGVDTSVVKPNPSVRLLLPSGHCLTRSNPVLTYSARNLEPYRGFHSFLRALPGVQRALPNLFTVIVGGDEVSYGRKPTAYATWREQMVAEVGTALDLNRIWFAGKLPYAEYLKVLQVSSAHAYLTYPFVPSWSLLEAVAVGCRLIASDVGPVREMLHGARDARLVPFHSLDAITTAIIESVRGRNDPSNTSFSNLRGDLDMTTHTIPSYQRLLDDLLKFKSRQTL